MLYLPLRLIRSAPGQKAEAKLVNSFHRERSQGRAEMRGREVASLPGESGLHMGQSQGRASPFLAKSVLSANIETQPSHSRHRSILCHPLVHWQACLPGTGRLDSSALALHEIQKVQLPRQPPTAGQAMRAARSVEIGKLLPRMRTASSQAMSKNVGWILHGGVHSVQIRGGGRGGVTRRGRPEPERGTPVNMENRLHRDNGEGVTSRPLPYPLEAYFTSNLTLTMAVISFS